MGVGSGHVGPAFGVRLVTLAQTCWPFICMLLIACFVAGLLIVNTRSHSGTTQTYIGRGALRAIVANLVKQMPVGRFGRDQG